MYMLIEKEKAAHMRVVYYIPGLCTEELGRSENNGQDSEHRTLQKLFQQEM